MAKACKPCMAKKSRGVAKFSSLKYVLKNAQGQVIKEFGNKTSAAIALSKNPGYTLHPIDTGAPITSDQDSIGEQQ